MAEPKFESEGQSDSASEPSIREQTINRLRAERGEKPLPSKQESEAPSPGAAKEEPGSGSDGQDEKSRQPAQSQETHDEDEEYEANETDDEDDEQESDDAAFFSDDEDDDDEEEPGPSDTPGELLVDDRRYSVDDIRALQKRDQERDADYRRKTTVNNRIRDEYEVTGTELTAVSNYFVGMAEANLKNLDSMDVEQMSQEEFAVWKRQKAAAVQGAQQLKGQIDKVKGGIHERIDKMRDHQSAESAEILQGIESRWNNEFYSKIRDFAVESGRYTKDSFKEVRDWQTIEGLIALHDMAEARKKVNSTTRKTKGGENISSKQEEPTRKPRRRRNRQQRRSNKSGQFQNAQAAAQESKSSIKDGTFRAATMARLAKERGE